MERKVNMNGTKMSNQWNLLCILFYMCSHLFASIIPVFQHMSVMFDERFHVYKIDDLFQLFFLRIGVWHATEYCFVARWSNRRSMFWWYLECVYVRRTNECFVNTFCIKFLLLLRSLLTIRLLIWRARVRGWRPHLCSCGGYMCSVMCV